MSEKSLKQTYLKSHLSQETKTPQNRCQDVWVSHSCFFLYMYLLVCSCVDPVSDFSLKSTFRQMDLFLWGSDFARYWYWALNLQLTTFVAWKFQISTFRETTCLQVRIWSLKNAACFDGTCCVPYAAILRQSVHDVGLEFQREQIQKHWDRLWKYVKMTKWTFRIALLAFLPLLLERKSFEI